MPEPNRIVINTGPILALVAALGNLEVLQMYEDVWAPWEVCQEIRSGGREYFAVTEFEAAHWLTKENRARNITPLLTNLLDRGEAAVIQLALDEEISTVCIDETLGRRMARLNELNVTGTIGVLLRAQREGHRFVMRAVLEQMRNRGVWLSESVVRFAIEHALE
jgi:predicted nucleic acid-binding protein